MALMLRDAEDDFQSKKGQWKSVGYTKDLSIEVNKQGKTKLADFAIYLRDKKANRFIARMKLEAVLFGGKVFYTPHSYIDPAYRGRGLFKPLYRWILNHGLSLVSDDRQSKFSNSMWRKLSDTYAVASFPVDVKREALIIDRHDSELISKMGYYSVLFSKNWKQKEIDSFVKKVYAAKPWKGKRK